MIVEYKSIQVEDIKSLPELWKDGWITSIVVKDRIILYREVKQVKTNTIPKDNKWFLLFYSLYPKKISKVTAQRAFEKLTPAEVNKVNEVLQSHIAYWRKKYGKVTTMIPYPATWLNQKRFDDVLSLSDIPEPEKNTDWKEAKEKEIKALEIQQREKEEEEKHKQEVNTETEKLMARYAELSFTRQEEIKKQAEEELPEAIKNTKDRFPDQYKKLRFAKIMQIVRNNN